MCSSDLWSASLWSNLYFYLFSCALRVDFVVYQSEAFFSLIFGRIQSLEVLFIVVLLEFVLFKEFIVVKRHRDFW